jgi:hypothetical protein
VVHTWWILLGPNESVAGSDPYIDERFQKAVTMLRRELWADRDPREAMFGVSAWSTLDSVVPRVRAEWAERQLPWRAWDRAAEADNEL